MGAPRLILDILSIDLPVLKAVTGAYNLAEVEKNLQAKLPAAIPVFRSCLKLMNIEIVPLPTKRDLPPLAGMTAEKDLPVIASALQGAADFLVTGDKKDLLKIKKNRLPFSIVSPAEFLDEVLPGLLKGPVPPA
jgi:predicted nucleic acid-binding protein